MAKKGTFIVFEGGEGSGKDTQIDLLRPLLSDAVFTKEPGGTALGMELRVLLLDGKKGGMDPLTELFLFSASRVQFMKEIVRPALETGKTVISNRFALSTIAYQVYGRERPDLFEPARAAIKAAVGDETPDMTIFLDVTPEVGMARVASRAEEHTRFDDESLAFHERVREGYLKHINELGPSVVIDGSRGVEEVHTDILKALHI